MNKLALVVLFAACGGSGLGADVRTDITARMQTAQTPIQGCYASALKTNHKLTGTIVIDFAAAPKTGQFVDVTVSRDELADPTVKQCVVDEVGKLKLDKPQSSRVAISYPIHFAPNPSP